MTHRGMGHGMAVAHWKRSEYPTPNPRPPNTDPGRASGLRQTVANRLLARLPTRELDAVLGASELSSVSRGDWVHRQDSALSHVWFPLGAIFSLVLAMADGRLVETATVGNEGMVGLPVYLGLALSSVSAMAQVAGAALRVSTAAFLKLIRDCPTLDQLMRRYVAYSLRFGNQTIACNTLHSVEERACRWLLMTFDRVASHTLQLTHERLAERLGVHRQTVTVTAGTLQRAGYITDRRGRIQIRDRAGLEHAACECYRATVGLYERMLG